jgi:hypothetical protein
MSSPRVERSRANQPKCLNDHHFGRAENFLLNIAQVVMSGRAAVQTNRVKIKLAKTARAMINY